ncbi:hypothetical protein [Sphingobium lactosutens]|uniref:Uncharacterized protein n=1 Tax=Sphingobium lactosutens DS20 TaxID=1331060 RepID=T0HJ25_9SPHN|nr:hypothetical protein [Sphingobium lactosutens]EQB12158.1 hypothetical protein RLDS_20615 [Sphingobium lactosutens DS20]
MALFFLPLSLLSLLGGTIRRRSFPRFFCCLTFSSFLLANLSTRPPCSNLGCFLLFRRLLCGLLLHLLCPSRCLPPCASFFTPTFEGFKAGLFLWRQFTDVDDDRIGRDEITDLLDAGWSSSRWPALPQSIFAMLSPFRGESLSYGRSEIN